MTVVVTGAAGDIGAAIAERFVRRGDFVIASDLNGDALEARLQAHVRRGRCACLVSDLRDATDVERLAKSALDRYGPVSVLVNNAAIQHDGTALDVSLARFEESFAVNVRAPFILARCLVPDMIEAGGGAIINVASVHAVAAGPAKAAYVTTKAALLGLTRSMAVDFGRDNIRVNAVLPTAIRTSNLEEGWASIAQAGGGDILAHAAAQHPVRRIGEPDEVAEVVEYLATARFVTGVEIRVDGGLLAALRLLPEREQT